MKKTVIRDGLFCVIALFALLSCGRKDDLKIVNYDFELKAKLLEPKTMIGKPVQVVVEIGKWDVNNEARITATFTGKGSLSLDGKNYGGETPLEYDFRKKGMKFEGGFVPTATGTQRITFKVQTEKVTKEVEVSLEVEEPRTDIVFGDVPEGLLPGDEFDLSLLLSTNNEEMRIKKVFVQGAGEIKMNGALMKEEWLPVGKISTLVVKAKEPGAYKVELIFKGKYGAEKKKELSFSVGIPEWISTLEKVPTEEVVLEKPVSFSLNAERKRRVGGEFPYTGTYRFVSGSGKISINSSEREAGAPWTIQEGTSTIIFTPSSLGECKVEFTLKDMYGTEKKKEAVFRVKKPVSKIIATFSQNSQTVAVGDKAEFLLTVSEKDYKGTFTVSYKLLDGQGTSDLSTAKILPAGSHRFYFIPGKVGTNTFQVIVRDSHGQEGFAEGTVIAYASDISLSTNISQAKIRLGETAKFTLNVSERNYDGGFVFRYRMLSGRGAFKLKDVIYSPDIPIDITGGATPISFTPETVGDSGIELEVEDERGQVKATQIVVNSYVMVTVTGKAGGTVSGGGKVNIYQSNIIVKAVPDEGYKFDGWYKGDLQVSPNMNYSFIPTSDTSLEGRFSKKTYAVTLSRQAGGSIEGGGIFNFGTSVTVRATPSEGYLFDGWYDEGDKLVSKEADYTFTVSKKINLHARFTVKNYTLTVSNTTGGKVNAHGRSYPHGQMVSLTAVPDGKFKFDGWFEGDALVSGSAEYRFVIKKNTNLEARFSNLVFRPTFTVNIPEAGTISGATPTYEYGDMLDVSVADLIPDGYNWIGWMKNGVLMTTERHIRFNIKDQADYVAKYEIKTFDVSVDIQNGTNQANVRVIGGKINTILDFKQALQMKVQYNEIIKFILMWGNEDKKRLDINGDTKIEKLPGNDERSILFKVLGPGRISGYISSNPQ